MKKYIKYAILIALAIIIVFVVTLTNRNKTTTEQDNGKFKIVTSFYPMYVIALNITDGANNIELTNMADMNTGCIHDYTLLASDMKKIEKADVLIQNGLGLENFISKILNNQKDLAIIDASENISDFIQEESGVNPHIWTSITNYIKQVENISKGLMEKNPENAEIYQRNTENYIETLTNLRKIYEVELNYLKGKAAVCLNESFEYLGKELELNLKSIHTSHEESALSAKELKDVIDWMKENKATMIIVDRNDDLKNAQTLAEQTGAKIYKLDSALTGSSSKDAYINSIKENMEVLKRAE